MIRRMRLACLATIVAVWPALAEEYGPFRYRTGSPESFLQFETVISWDGTKAVLRDCAQKFGGVIQTDRQCWDDGLIDVRRSGQVLKIASSDVYLLNMSKNTLTIVDLVDGHTIVAEVKAGRFDWSLTPASWERSKARP